MTPDIMIQQCVFHTISPSYWSHPPHPRPLGNHHDYDDVAPDLFQLSEEDVHAFGTNDKLREVLVPFENLEITGELGEGVYETMLMWKLLS